MRRHDILSIEESGRGEIALRPPSPSSPKECHPFSRNHVEFASDRSKPYHSWLIKSLEFMSETCSFLLQVEVDNNHTILQPQARSK